MAGEWCEWEKEEPLGLEMSHCNVWWNAMDDGTWSNFMKFSKFRCRMTQVKLSRPSLSLQA